MNPISYNDFLQRWDIKSEIDPNVEFNKLKIRIKNALGEVEDNIYGLNITREYCNVLGIEYKNDDMWCVYKSLFIGISDEKKFLYRLETLFSFDFIFSQEKTKLIELIKKAFGYSELNISVLDRAGRIYFYPKGEKTLDLEMVEKSLSFFNESSNEHFINALTLYQQHSSQNRIKSAESLRRALEEFLKFKLKNNKGLKENISELLKILKSDGRDPFVRNIVGQTFTLLDNYFNENSKHNDGDINESENEFLIYQTGLLCRYINKTII